MFDYPTAFRLWDACEMEAIGRVIESGRYTMAGEVEAFEDEFAKWHGRKHGIMVNSGSSANLIAVAAVAHHRRLVGCDERPYAFAPAIAWATTYAPFVQHGFDFKIWDVDDTWNAPVRLPAYCPAWSAIPEVVVACSILGSPAYLTNAAMYATSENAILIEDNCESLGAKTEEGYLTGTFGTLSTFSFYYSHQISAIEGGMVLTDSDTLAHLCRLLRNHGNAGWGSKHFEYSYDFVLHGYNVRPLEMHAAIAREQLKKLPQMCEARWTNALYFELEASGLPIKHQLRTGTPTPFGLAFTVESRKARARLVAAFRKNGIDSRLPTGGSLTRHLYAKQWADQPTPCADRIHDTGIFIGCAPFQIFDKIDRAVEVMKKVL